VLHEQFEIRLEGVVEAGVVQGNGAQVGHGLEKRTSCLSNFRSSFV
jgi:hypothetical protein